ncbi:MAG: hypothetical protein GF418_16050 [Chitinivibrionales bacterium]|nr:hypothetical protein [Chitinivibrionales bacterium]
MTPEQINTKVAAARCWVVHLYRKFREVPAGHPTHTGGKWVAEYLHRIPGSEWDDAGQGEVLVYVSRDGAPHVPCRGDPSDWYAAAAVPFEPCRRFVIERVHKGLVDDAAFRMLDRNDWNPYAEANAALGRLCELDYVEFDRNPFARILCRRADEKTDSPRLEPSEEDFRHALEFVRYRGRLIHALHSVSAAPPEGHQMSMPTPSSRSPTKWAPNHPCPLSPQEPIFRVRTAKWEALAAAVLSRHVCDSLPVCDIPIPSTNLCEASKKRLESLCRRFHKETTPPLTPANYPFFWDPVDTLFWGTVATRTNIQAWIYAPNDDRPQGLKRPLPVVVGLS